MFNPRIKFKASDPKVVGKTLTPEKAVQLKELLGDDDLFNALLEQANGAVTEAKGRTAGMGIKAEDPVSSAPTLPTGSTADDTEAEAAAEGETAEEESDEQMLLSQAEIDQIADAVMNRIMSKLDELNAGVSAIDTEMKARGYQRAKDDGSDTQATETRIKALEVTIEALTTDHLPRNVMSILAHTRGGVELKAEEGEALTNTSPADALGSTRSFLFSR